jgi:hypothetical protein
LDGDNRGSFVFFFLLSLIKVEVLFMPRRNSKRFYDAPQLSEFTYRCLVDGCKELPSDEIFASDYGKVIYARTGVRRKTNERLPDDAPLYLCARHVADNVLWRRLGSPRLQQLIFDF